MVFLGRRKVRGWHNCEVQVMTIAELESKASIADAGITYWWQQDWTGDKTSSETLHIVDEYGYWMDEAQALKDQFDQHLAWEKLNYDSLETFMYNWRG